MTLKNAKKKIAKLGYELTERGQKFLFVHNGYTISFMVNPAATADLDIFAIYSTKVKRTEDDMNSDYWPGEFYDNLTQALKYSR